MNNNPNLTRDDKRAEGKAAAKILLPFLRTDVPSSSVYELALLVARWSGFGDDANFALGFVSQFQDYHEAQSLKLTAPRVVEGS